MDNTYLNVILAFAAVLLPIGLAAVLIELKARRNAAQGHEGQRDTR